MDFWQTDSYLLCKMPTYLEKLTNSSPSGSKSMKSDDANPKKRMFTFKVKVMPFSICCLQRMMVDPSLGSCDGGINFQFTVDMFFLLYSGQKVQIIDATVYLLRFG